MTTSELLLSELEEAGKDLMKYGEHEGSCTNENQMKLAPKVTPCQKHASAMKKREDRFKRALEQLNLLRDVFGTSHEI